MTDDTQGAVAQRLTGKRCLITGGSRGLGRALVHRFAVEGARVAFTYREREDDARMTVELVGEGLSRPLAYRCDNRDSGDVRATVRQVIEALGGLDVLVNNASVTQVVPIGLLEEPDWELVMDTNVTGAFRFIKAALKPMIKQRAGAVLQIGSFGAERVVEAPVHYAASKGALLGMTRALAAEVGRYGVAVNYLAPGLLDDGMGTRLPPHRVADYRSQAGLQRTGTVDEIARSAAFIVSSNMSFTTGAALVADGAL
jgi:3-oxoacyl-[acyl-carrier protein] reductase